MFAKQENQAEWNWLTPFPQQCEQAARIIHCIQWAGWQEYSSILRDILHLTEIQSSCKGWGTISKCLTFSVQHDTIGRSSGDARNLFTSCEMCEKHTFELLVSSVPSTSVLCSVAATLVSLHRLCCILSLSLCVLSWLAPAYRLQQGPESWLFITCDICCATPRS